MCRVLLTEAAGDIQLGKVLNVAVAGRNICVPYPYYIPLNLYLLNVFYCATTLKLVQKTLSPPPGCLGDLLKVKCVISL